MNTSHYYNAIIVTLILAIGYILSSEFYYSSRRFATSNNHDNLWTSNPKEMDKLSGQAADFIGGLRNKFELKIPIWKRLKGDRHFQPAIIIITSRLILRYLAKNEKFRDKLIMDVTDQKFFSFFDSQQVDKVPCEMLANYRDETNTHTESSSLDRGGAGKGIVINRSKSKISERGFGDFDDDGKTDLFHSPEDNRDWLVSYGGTGKWQTVNTSKAKISEIRFGDFDGNGKTDVFHRPPNSRDWLVSYGGTGEFSKINESAAKISEMGFGDFDGDGKTDVFHRPENSRDWLVSYGGTGKWQTVNTSKAKISEMGFGDFDGDGKTDVFHRPPNSRDWLVSYGGTGEFSKINESAAKIFEMGFGDFNGDGKTDVFHPALSNIPPSIPPGGGGSGSSSGQEVVHANKLQGVDCDCSRSGKFLDPLPQSNENTSGDGAYRVTKTVNSVSVFRNADNVRVFNENNLSNGFQSGFGPQSRYFLLIAPHESNRVSVGVHDLEGTSSDNRAFFDSNVLSDAGWGFSPDGRTFLLARKTNVSAFTLNLVNLDARDVEIINFSDSFSAFYQFSQCGDAFIVVNQASATASGKLNLYTTVDLEEVVHNLSLESDYTGIESNSSNYVAPRTNGATQIISSNTAMQSCQIPIRNGGIYDLQMVRFPNTNISSSEANQLFGEATDFIKTSSSIEDVGCNITFNLVGNILDHTVGDGSIDDASEETAAFRAPGQVKLVNRINYCGKVIPALGCAPIPGRSFIFTREEDEITTFAHEFGHNRGLNHDSDINSLMYELGGPQAINISESQCNTFKGVIANIVGDGLLVINKPAENVSIEEFVRRSYFEGVPFEKVQEYESNVVLKLLKMLKDPSEKKHWSNIVVTLGMIGDIRAFDPMVDFIENNPVITSEQHYNARTNAILSLGYLLNATDNDRLLNYLKNSLSPNIWNERKIEGTTNYQLNATERNIDFSKYAILALTVAGTQSSRELLDSLNKTGASEADIKFRLRFSQLITNSIKEHKKISENGLKKYYSINKY